MIDPEGYGRALSSLRNAIADPEESHSVETLAAATILFFLEVSLHVGIQDPVDQAGRLWGRSFTERDTPCWWHSPSD
jgi:hypothetical protein